MYVDMEKDPSIAMSILVAHDTCNLSSVWEPLEGSIYTYSKFTALLRSARSSEPVPIEHELKMTRTNNRFASLKI